MGWGVQLRVILSAVSCVVLCETAIIKQSGNERGSKVPLVFWFLKVLAGENPTFFQSKNTPPWLNFSILKLDKFQLGKLYVLGFLVRYKAGLTRSRKVTRLFAKVALSVKLLRQEVFDGVYDVGSKKSRNSVC